MNEEIGSEGSELSGNAAATGEESLGRRRFLKRSGGATAATILTWHGIQGKVEAAPAASGSVKVKRDTIVPALGAQTKDHWSPPVKIGGTGTSTKWKVIKVTTEVALVDHQQPKCLEQIPIFLAAKATVRYYEATGQAAPAPGAGWGAEKDKDTMPVYAAAAVVAAIGAEIQVSLRAKAVALPQPGEPTGNMNVTWTPKDGPLKKGSTVGVASFPDVFWKGCRATLAAADKVEVTATYKKCP